MCVHTLYIGEVACFKVASGEEDRYFKHSSVDSIYESQKKVWFFIQDVFVCTVVQDRVYVVINLLASFWLEYRSKKSARL